MLLYVCMYVCMYACMCVIAGAAGAVGAGVSGFACGVPGAALAVGNIVI